MDDIASVTHFQKRSLDIPQFAGKSFHIIGVEGREAVSRPYDFRVVFTCPDALDEASALGKPATFTLTTGGHDLVVAGVVMEFACEDPTPSGDFCYSVSIGPHFALLELCRQNQVYGTDTAITVADIIDGKLKNTFSRSSTSGGETIHIDYELRLSGNYSARNHVVQFDESDLHFLSRTCENAGIFYFFEHSKNKDNLVLGDANIAFDGVPPPNGSGDCLQLPFRLTRGQADDA
jgi:type VI secretion system secreted protein VgrG